MSGGSKPKMPAPTPPAPTAMDAQVEAAKADIRQRRKRAFSRQDTQVTLGGMGELKDTLG